MNNIIKSLNDLNIALPKPVKPIANYSPYTIIGDTIYISGQIPFKDGSLSYQGKVGKDISINEAINASEICLLNTLAILNLATGNDLNKTKVKKKVDKSNKFLYSIKIADFYYKKSAHQMVERIKNKTSIKRYKVLSLSKTKFRVILGPFNDINSLKNSYNNALLLNFENLEIIHHD